MLLFLIDDLLSFVCWVDKEMLVPELIKIVQLILM